MVNKKHIAYTLFIKLTRNTNFNYFILKCINIEQNLCNQGWANIFFVKQFSFA